MKTLFLSTLISLFAFTLQAQLNVTQEIGSENLSGTTYFVEEGPSINDFEHPFYVTNVSGEDLTIGCRRTELDVITGVGIEGVICWVICPPFVEAGTQPVFTAPFNANVAAGATDSSFVMHHLPNGVDGCARYLIEWFNGNDDSEVYASVELVLDHSTGSCVLSLDENEELSAGLWPNPASGDALLTLEQVNTPVNVKIIDLLGKVRSTFPFNPADGNSRTIDTSGLSNGIYFVSLSDNTGILKTLKLVVKR